MATHTNTVAVLVALAMIWVGGCGRSEQAAEDAASLIKQLASDDEDTHLRAAWKLTKLEGSALAPLGEAIQSKNRTLALRAGDVLRNIGQPAVDTLTQAMGDANANWPYIAAAALAQIEPKASAAVDTLIVTLKKGDAEARALAADTLGRLQIDPKTIINALLKTLRDDDENVCKNAAQSLVAIGKPALDSLISAMSDSQIKHKHHVALAIARFGADASKAGEAILTMLNPDDAESRALVVFTLGKIRAKSDQVISALIKMFDDAENRVADTAAQNVGRMGAVAIDPLLKVFENKETAKYRRAAFALSIIGHEASKATDALLALLTQGDKETRGMAAFALSKISHGDKKVVSALVDVVTNGPGPSDVQMYAAEALGRITPPATDAIPALTEAMKHADQTVRQAAAEAIKNIKSPPATQPHSGCSSGCVH
ncbi:MAG: hypothetical protein HN350_09370 [Phycisphaerales bacterium]|nr:hypothetical protein [Phycisphaerales bacterium]